MIVTQDRHYIEALCGVQHEEERWNEVYLQLSQK